jgi:hypothetical protein
MRAQFSIEQEKLDDRHANVTRRVALSAFAE